MRVDALHPTCATLILQSMCATYTVQHLSNESNLNKKD